MIRYFHIKLNKFVCFTFSKMVYTWCSFVESFFLIKTRKDIKIIQTLKHQCLTKNLLEKLLENGINNQISKKSLTNQPSTIPRTQFSLFQKFLSVYNKYKKNSCSEAPIFRRVLKIFVYHSIFIDSFIFLLLLIC